MTGPEAARAVSAVASVLRLRGALTADEVIALISMALGVETLSQKRSRAGAVGGRASAEARANQPPKQRRSKGEAKPEANAKQNDFASVEPRAVSGQDLSTSGSQIRTFPKDSEVVAKEPEPSPARLAATTAPANFDEAITEPICSRALAVRGNPTLGNLLGVTRWPEVVEVSQAWHTAGNRQGSPRVTQGVADALVSIWAEGFLQRDVVRVARYLPTTQKYADRVLPSCLSVEVVTIALGELERVEGDRNAITERLRRAGGGF